VQHPIPLISNLLSRNALWAAFISLSAIVVWPDFGDTIREPKWALLWISTIFFLPSIIGIKELPKAVFFLLPYFWIQPLLFSSISLTYFYLFSISAILILATYPLGKSISLKIITRMLAIITLLNIFYGFAQLLNIDPIFTRIPDPKNPNPFIGFFGHHTLLGAWCAAIAWFFYSQRKYPTFILCSIAVLVTGSAFSAFSWILGLFTVLLWNRKWKLFGALTTGIICLGLLFRKHAFFSAEGRFLAWRLTLSAWIERPWFGYGMDSYHREFHAYHQGARDRLWFQAHNEFLELLFAGGIMGFLLGTALLLLLLLQYRYWWRIPEKLPWLLLFICILGNSFGNFPYHIAPLAMLSAISYFQLIKKEKSDFF
jgi:O-antigen ligase